MLQLAATTDKLQLVTSAAVTVDVHCSYADHTLSGDNVEGNRQNTAISTATTTDILAAPASGTVRRVKVLAVRNKSNSASVDVTVLLDANGTDCELHKEALRAGETLQYTEALGFFRRPRLRMPDPYAKGMHGDTTEQGLFGIVVPGTEIYIPNESPIKAGTTFRWSGSWAKTAAGTAAGSWIVRFGATPTIAGSTARITLPLTTATAAADAGDFDIQAIVRGPIGASCIVCAIGGFRHHASTTGLFNLDHNIVQANSAAFDITERDMVVCISFFPSTSTVWTAHHVTAEAFNL
jgi:hypothetical protein